MNGEYKTSFNFTIGDSINVWFYTHFDYLNKNIRLSKIVAIEFLLGQTRCSTTEFLHIPSIQWDFTYTQSTEVPKDQKEYLLNFNIT